jgi:hypothetical protein
MIFKKNFHLSSYSIKKRDEKIYNCCGLKI